MKYEFLLFDLDDTLLDFHAAESSAIRELFGELNIICDDKMLSDYSAFNLSLWKQLEKGYITKDALISNRFISFFAVKNIDADGTLAKERYFYYLSRTSQLVDGALELLEALRGKARLFAVTNGVAKIQTSRIENAGISGYFEECFISENVGFQKPRREFFDFVQHHINGFDKRRALLTGDSLSADIKGGADAGIDTCWFNPRGVVNNTKLTPDYEISRLSQILSTIVK